MQVDIINLKTSCQNTKMLTKMLAKSAGACMTLQYVPRHDHNHYFKGSEKEIKECFKAVKVSGL